MNINPGELKKKIAIIQWEKIKDEDGFEKKVIKSKKSVWAKFQRKSMKELEENFANFRDIEVRFLIRYTEIDRDMEIEYNGELYQIIFLNNYGDNNRYIEIGARIKDNG